MFYTYRDMIGVSLFVIIIDNLATHGIIEHNGLVSFHLFSLATLITCQICGALMIF